MVLWLNINLLIFFFLFFFFYQRFFVAGSFNQNHGLFCEMYKSFFLYAETMIPWILSLYLRYPKTKLYSVTAKGIKGFEIQSHYLATYCLVSYLSASMNFKYKNQTGLNYNLFKIYHISLFYQPNWFIINFFCFKLVA